MSELNEKQMDLCNTIDGFVRVDAGPGTGKTHSIVQRYVNILKNGTNPMKVLMLTFTRNAAEEMETRITTRMSEIIAEDENSILTGAVGNLRVSTIDSFCMDVVLNSPETIRDFFDPDDKELMLSRSATLSENETLNRDYFANYYARFINEHGRDYTGTEDITAVLGENYMDIYVLINKLMSRGIIPRKKTWFGTDKDTLIGKKEETADSMRANMGKLVTKMKEMVKKTEFAAPAMPEKYNSIGEDIISDAVNEDREVLLKVIHDIYYGYIEQCIKDNRLTFGLCELFAFIILAKDEKSRNMHSVDYLTIDEFQDTNELQMKICLMILNKPNMCVVGDWKQGIFGFRYVSIKNITEFDSRIELFVKELSEAGIELPYIIPESIPVEFDLNYRSSNEILKLGFKSLDIPGNKEEIVNHDYAVPLTSMNEEWLDGNTDLNYILAKSKDDEIIKAVDMITEYRFSGRYRIVEKKKIDGAEQVITRDLEYGDIAVLCRSSANCTRMYEECTKRGIPAYLQGDIEIMSTREGKLALAWLRFVNDRNDARGLTTILVDAGYPLSEIKMILDSNGELIPHDIQEQLSELRKRKRRINDLITGIFDYYGLNNGVVQTIINVLSSAHSGSLMTVSDLIRLIEDDIQACTKYNVEPLIDMKAVTIQTAHKSKGLEYPVVMIVGLDQGSFPSTKQGNETLKFDDKIGVRCTNSLIGEGEHTMVVKSWRTALIRAGFPIDYSEERRLLFVAMTRAKQYLTLVAYNPSKFFEYYQNHRYREDEDCKDLKGFREIAEPEVHDPKAEGQSEDPQRPEIGEYARKRLSVSAHDLMATIPDPKREGKKEGKGQEYGEKVHNKAYLYLRRGVYDDSVEEMSAIKAIVDGLKGSKLSGEIKFVLPVDDVSIKGTIDLLAEFDDRVEIHDYKTDPDKDFLQKYRLQVSIYALAAESLGKKVDCYIDFITIGETVKVDPFPLEYIKERIRAYKEEMGIPL